MEQDSFDPLSHSIIGASMRVHDELGPGLLEAAYEECLVIELRELGMSLQRQPLLPIEYRGHRIEGAFRPDLVVEGKVIVEIKSVQELLQVHRLQLRTYLRLRALDVGLLLNFNVATLRHGGIRRVRSLR